MPPRSRAGCAMSAKASPKQRREGGFLGFGGTAVSDAEKATLADISSALNLPA